jgi:16S rRNA (adenine1518-N6/adenine1519-N6)-dimethyltransferase
MTNFAEKRDFIQAKKRFGQNFLINQAVKMKVVSQVSALIEEYKPKSLLEIGPGKGDFSKLLLEENLPLTLLELDDELIPYLRTQDWFVEAGDRVSLIHLDALDEVSNPDSPYFRQAGLLFSSLPYNVGSRILVDLGLNFPTTPFAVIIQKEVASRICISKPNLLGFWLGLFWNSRKSFDIAAGNFQPAPKVTSSLLVAKPKVEIHPLLQDRLSREIALNTLQKLMHNPNKTLSNNLRNLGWSSQKVQDFLHSQNLSEKTRMEKENFEKIFFGVLTELVGKST